MEENVVERLERKEFIEEYIEDSTLVKIKIAVLIGFLIPILSAVSSFMGVEFYLIILRTIHVLNGISVLSLLITIGISLGIHFKKNMGFSVAMLIWGMLNFNLPLMIAGVFGIAGAMDISTEYNVYICNPSEYVEEK